MDALADTKSDVIYVDIDQVWEAWSPRLWSLFLARCTQAQERAGFSIRKIQARKSSSGKIHAKIIFEDPVSIDVTFLVRAFLGDDPFRLAADMVRWVKYGKGAEVNRIFDTKFIDNEVRRAGPWIDLGLLARP
jgi:hypothetical protein